MIPVKKHIRKANWDLLWSELNPHYLSSRYDESLVRAHNMIARLAVIVGEIL